LRSKPEGRKKAGEVGTKDPNLPKGPNLPKNGWKKNKVTKEEPRPFLKRGGGPLTFLKQGVLTSTPGGEEKVVSILHG